MSESLSEIASSYTLKVLCKYRNIKTNKNYLPLFIRFKENNHLEFIFDNTVSKEAINKVIDMSRENWFDNLEPIKFSKEFNY